MIIEIHDNKTIAEVQEKFNELFPFLKIEFYNEAHHWHQASSTSKQLSPEKTFGEIRKKHTHGVMKIYSTYRTGDLENSFRQKFGLHIQVFRHHGNEWVQTVGTDKLTLEEQNEIGRKTSTEYQSAVESKTEKENLR